MSDNLDDVLETNSGQEDKSSVSSSKNMDISLKYPALRIISVVYKILAIIFAVAAIIGLFVGLSKLDHRYTKELGIIISLYSVFVGFFLVVTFLAVSEGIKLFIDIEENTRKMWQKLK